MSPLLAKVIDSIAHLKAQGATQSQIATIIAAILNSPILAAAVAATPTPFDDMILSVLKMLFPAPAAVAA